MLSREEPLTKRERAELEGYVSAATTFGRALLFLAAVGLFGALCWRVQQWLSVAVPYWLLPTLAFAALLYRRSRRWTGGRAFRDLMRLDLEANSALVHHITACDAIVFEEQEDEGPVVFVLTDEDETVVFTGQELARHVSRGFPWREFEVRESATSRRFLRFKRLAEPLPVSDVRPPLSAEQYKLLGLGAVVVWQPLGIPFAQLRQIV